jgi:hypothetical protein
MGPDLSEVGLPGRAHQHPSGPRRHTDRVQLIEGKRELLDQVRDESLGQGMFSFSGTQARGHLEKGPQEPIRRPHEQLLAAGRAFPRAIHL